MTDFEQVYREYFRDVELYLMALCKDPHLAEELTAQTFFQAMKALPKFRGECDIRTWLCALAKNCYLMHLRKNRQTVPLEELNIPEPKPTVEEQVMDKNQAMAIHKVLHIEADDIKSHRCKIRLCILFYKSCKLLTV